jgi:hypothetical protein
VVPAGISEIGLGSHFPDLPPLASDLSVEDISQGIAALLDSPNTWLNRSRFEFYQHQLPPETAAAVLRQLTSQLTEGSMLNFHRRQWRGALVMLWGEAEPVAALDFVMDHYPKGKVNLEDDSSTVSLLGLLKASNTHPAKILGWLVRAETADHGWPSGNRLWKALIAGQRWMMLQDALNAKSLPAIEILVEAANNHHLNWICEAAKSHGETPISSDKLTLLAEVAPRITSPAFRDDLQRSILASISKSDFAAAKQFVEPLAMPS